MQAPDLTGVSSEEVEERRLPGRNSMKMKTNPVQTTVRQSQQFKYGRLEPDTDGSTPNASPIRPHRPAPGWNSDRNQAYKSLPDLQKVYQVQIKGFDDLN